MIVRGEEGLQSGEKTLPARVLGAGVIVMSRYLLFDHSLIKEFCLETSGRVIFSVPPPPSSARHGGVWSMVGLYGWPLPFREGFGWWCGIYVPGYEIRGTTQR
jgi:hypothetical protein